MSSTSRDAVPSPQRCLGTHSCPRRAIFPCVKSMLSLRSWRNWRRARILKIKSFRHLTTPFSEMQIFFPAWQRSLSLLYSMRMEHVCMIAYELHYYRGTLFMMFANHLKMSKLHWKRCNNLLKGRKKMNIKLFLSSTRWLQQSINILSVCLFVSPAELLNFPPDASFASSVILMEIRKNKLAVFVSSKTWSCT